MADGQRLTADRTGWKDCVEERMNHLNIWQGEKDKRYEWEASEERRERVVRVVERLVCRYEGCRKVPSQERV